MTMLSVYVIVSCFVFIENAILQTENKDKETSNCVTLSEDNLKMFQNLETLLERNVNFENHRIGKVLEEFGESSRNLVKYELHQQFTEMIAEIKSTLSRQERSYTTTATITESNHEASAPGSGNASIITEDNSRRPTDCSELLVTGQRESGVYYIYPFTCSCTKPVKVYCDMETDGGGWTVFLTRSNASNPINFTRNWEEYKHGFGTLEEYWLGNEALHTMTYNKIYTLRMEASDGERRNIWGEWSSIIVHSEDEKYKLVVTGHNAKSTAYDRFAYITTNFFSTYDADNDRHGINCAQTYKGGWWYNACVYNNPTGIYGKVATDGITVNPWSKTDYYTVRYPTRLQLKIRPQICSSQVSIVQINKDNCVLN